MKFDPAYQGMRWFKCDLHVHTPEDAHHWTDESLKLSSPRSEPDLQEKARRFLEYCFKLELDCIAVTDHNFSAEQDSRKWFLTHLIEQNKTVAEKHNREPLFIFPGFELNIRYHILCLLDPIRRGAELVKLDDLLTGMGLSRQERFNNHIPRQPKHHGQCWSLREILDRVQKEMSGIVIAAHAFSNDGICNDTANIADFRDNPDLNAVEINSWPPVDKARMIIDGSNVAWKRPHPDHQPAPLCSSDGKSLTQSGNRFSWIKMSAPSCEALRQAFLDSESRIHLQSKPPDVSHIHIRDLRIQKNRFLKDQQITFSPHLNCVIGGRGSGKSLLFESLRLGLRGEMAIKDIDEKDHVAVKQIKRLRGTFDPGSHVEIGVFHEDLKDRFLVDESGLPARIISREVDDPPTIFRRLNAVIFSQEEITQLSDRQRSLIDFIDNLTGDRLDQARSEAEGIIARLKAARQVENRVQKIDGELIVLKQELSELSRRLEARTLVQEELKHHRSAQEARQYFDSIGNKAAEIEQRLKDFTEDIAAEPPPLGTRLEKFPEKLFFKQLEKEIDDTYRDLEDKINSAADAFSENIHKTTSGHPDWDKIQTVLREAEDRFKKSCDQKGLTPHEAEQVRETEARNRAKQAAFHVKNEERKNLERQIPNRMNLLNLLSAAWRKETEIRRSILRDITASDTMPRTRSDKPILKTELTFAGDHKGFLRLWADLAPDRRKAVGRVWDDYAQETGQENIGEQIFKAFQENLQKRKSEGDEYFSGNPILWLEEYMESPEKLPPLVRQYLSDIKTVQREKSDKWFELSLKRIPDSSNLTLFRNDDTEAGSFEKGDLSTGQKNTAILSLLLARGNGPVLIDQPEDELDGEFLFRELVPMFRKAKQQRQFIIVTHNANIPVNADAELIYALKAENGHGTCRAPGGMDRPEVAEAVLDIMEGSEEAFRKRKEKYHF